MVQENNLKDVIVICGPTASGKTKLAVELAKRLNTEIISADALYIYKKLNIGTAKPDIIEMDGVKHHLIDVIEPTEEFSVSDFERLATPIIKRLHSEGKVPIICGGTGFYINSLLFDLSYGKVAQNQEIRSKYEHLAQEFGNGYVHKILEEIDPVSAKEIHENNVKRVIRAIEIYEVSGTRKSDINDDNCKKYNYHAYAIDYPRELLNERINKRVDIMLNNGLIEEVTSLLNYGLKRNNQSMQGIGYKEVFDYLDGKIDRNELSELIKLNTRHYAKRQITFFKRLEGLKYIDYTVKDKADYIINDVKL